MMGKRIRSVLAAGLVLAGAVSCSVSAGDIRIEEVLKVDMGGTTLTRSRADVVLAAANDSRMKITVREANLRVHTAQSDVLELSVEKPVVLPRRSETEVTLPVSIRFRGTGGAMGAIWQLKDPRNLLVSGVVRLRGGAMNKKYEVKGVPLDEFLHGIGIDPDTLTDFER